MYNLQFASNFVEGDTNLDNAFLNSINIADPKFAFIPSQTDKTRKFYNFVVNRYSKLGINDFIYFDLDEEYDSTKINELINSDIIFLSGGNTFYFLDSIIKYNFKQVLIDFVQNGGALIGQSAGAIIMTEKINLAYSGDENEIGLNNFDGLNLVDFEINCHLNWNKKGLLTYTTDYSQKHPNKTIYAFEDGEGIIVNGNNIKFIGNILKVLNGKIINK